MSSSTSKRRVPVMRTPNRHGLARPPAGPTSSIRSSHRLGSRKCARGGSTRGPALLRPDLADHFAAPSPPATSMATGRTISRPAFRTTTTSAAGARTAAWWWCAGVFPEVGSRPDSPRPCCIKGSPAVPIPRWRTIASAQRSPPATGTATATTTSPSALPDMEQTIGGVQIYYGWSTGFQTAHSEYITEEIAGGLGNTSYGAEFGSALAVGNFDTMPTTTSRSVPGSECNRSRAARSCGAVRCTSRTARTSDCFPGWATGSRRTRSISRRRPRLGDQFGRAIAAGDFDPDSYDDLAIGVPGENNHGIVQILFGSQWGLLFAENILWAAGGGGTGAGGWRPLRLLFRRGRPRRRPLRGSRDRRSVRGSGDVERGPDAACVAFGSNSGFDLARTIPFHQGTLYPGDPDANRSGERFGWAMAAGDFDGDGLPISRSGIRTTPARNEHRRSEREPRRGVRRQPNLAVGTSPPGDWRASPASHGHPGPRWTPNLPTRRSATGRSTRAIGNPRRPSPFSTFAVGSTDRWPPP